MNLKEISNVKCFGGLQKVFTHESDECKCIMTFGIFLPEKSNTTKCPVVYYLSGLTCTEQNVITKSGFQQYASKYGLIVVCPDTSPRGDEVPDKPDEYDFGKGAGFYLDASVDTYSRNFRMFSYVTKELYSLVEKNFPVITGKSGLFGHSMGGHGALTIGLKCPDKFVSISAFSPICHPSECPWGKKAFTNYLGEDKSKWLEYDTVELLENSNKRFNGPVLIDQGDADNFLTQKQLLPDHLETTCKNKGIDLKLRMHQGYDHSYYFIATFMEDHIKFHVNNLSGKGSGE